MGLAARLPADCVDRESGGPSVYAVCLRLALADARLWPVAVGIRVGSNVWMVGEPTRLSALFETIAARLEPAGWGSRFPVVQRELYQGELPGEHATAALDELARLRGELSALPVDQVLFVDGEPPPPTLPADREAVEAFDAVTAIVCTAGRPVLDQLCEAVEYAASRGWSVRIVGVDVP